MEQTEKIAKRILLNVVAALRPPKRVAPSALPTKYFKRILVVKQHDQIGDLLVATPAIRAIRKRFPDAHIAVVVREYNAPMIWENPYVDAVILFYEKFNRWDMQKFRSFWSQLRGDGGFDCAVVLNSVSRSLSSDLIAVLSKAKYIVGPNHLSLDPDIAECIYSTATFRSKKLQHESEHYLDIVRQIGANPDGVGYDLITTEDEDREAEKVLYQMNVQSKNTLIGFHLGALNKEKRLPLEKAAKVIEWLKQNYNCEILLLSGPLDLHHRDELMSNLEKKTAVAIPVLPLRTATALIKKLTLLLCNDTGPMHMAAALNVPTVSFHSISDPVQWKPPHERHRAVRADDKKITSITVDMITKEVQHQLNALGIPEKMY